MKTSRQASILDAAAILDLDLGGARLIEASAGTGKTHTIADLYLRHILGGRQVGEILIVTYTNAATEELRGRIQRRLYQALNQLEDPESETDELLQLLRRRWRGLDSDARAQQLRRLQLALRCMDEAAISTIHGFCQRSLKEYALSGNQLFESDLQASDDETWEAAARDWWRRHTYDLEQDSLDLVKAALKDIDTLLETLLQLRSRPSARRLPAAAADFGSLLRQPRETARALHQLAPAWRRHHDQLVDILATSPALSRSQKLPYHAGNLSALVDAADRFFASPSPALPFRDFEFLGCAHLRQHSKPKKRGQDENLEHEFFRAVDEVADTWLEFRENLGAQLRAIAFDEIAIAVAERKRERALLAFQDQLTLLLRALESDRGADLAASLRRQYPVAMIDEFQDTDDIQYRIFSRIYLPPEDVSLTLIGDPKQAIYSFRGGDIFTYMQARAQPSIELFSLHTNWRSQPGLVYAINALFAHREQAFVYADSIAFTPAAAREENRAHQLQVGTRPLPGLVLWQLPQDDAGKNFNRDDTRERIGHALLAEIRALLDPRRENAATIDGRPLSGGDIAILVRRASEGQAVSRLLQRHGIATVTIGRDSVFHSDEARGLYHLLSAIAQHQDPAQASRSLGSSLLGLDYCRIGDIVGDDRAWQNWLDDLAELQQLWERQGFIAMFQAMMYRFELAPRLAAEENSERRITNLLHLAELLQQQSLACAGIAPLLGWFAAQFDESGREEAELRLEGDESLVKIVTIHKAKGLQYPVVFAPFLWYCRQVDRKGPVYFHDSDLGACFDLGSTDLSRHWHLAEKERLAEDLRLLYVALTRAHSRVYLAWGQAGISSYSGYASQTALAYLLHSQQTPAGLESAAVDGFPAGMDFAADLQRLLDAGGGNIELVPLPERSPAAETPQRPAAAPAPELARFRRGDLRRWRINSFTGLTRGIHQPGNRGAAESRGDSILDFPAGSHVGLLLHALLENLDFEADIEPQCASLFERFVPVAGLADEYRSALLDWLHCIVATPLDGEALCLNRLAMARRLNELEFDFALDRLDIAALNRFLQALSPQPLLELGGAEFSGMINGVIDLVFEYRGRYYLADYKSNFLGASLDDYLPANLQQAMLDRRYDLQSLIYTVALHRYLGERLQDYDYDRHFGGSYYLFLRALRPRLGNRAGVHFERSPRQTVEAFDRLLGFSPGGGVGA